MQPDDSYLNKIATEIWHHCWSSCKSKDLKRLSLVCRVFAAICQPLLFSTRYVHPPRVDSGNWMQTTQRIHIAVQRLLRLARSRHAASVRSWHWTGDYGSNMEHLVASFPRVTNISAVQERWGRLQQVFTTTLRSYHRLKELDIGFVTIDSEFRATLASLPVLDELTLRSCIVDARTGPLLSLRKFRISGFGAPEVPPGETHDTTLELVAPQTVHTLMLEDSDDSFAILQHLARHALPRLVHLHVRVADDAVMSLLECMENSPYLEGILISHFPPTSPPAYFQHRLPSTAISSLKSFSGPCDLTDLFTRDRPVERLVISGGTTDAEMLSILQNLGTTVALRELRISTAISPATISAILEAVSSSSLRKFSALVHEPPYTDPETHYDHGSPGDFIPDQEEDIPTEVEIDDRVVELWDEDVSVCAESDDDVVDDQASRTKATARVTPSVELPGYMYSVSGAQYSPKFEVPKTTESLGGIAEAMELIYTGAMSLPPSLEELDFSWFMFFCKPFTEREQHRAVLVLEEMLPCLCRVTLGGRLPLVLSCGVWSNGS
ncbi:hypothetical protein R3P38DRAFT_3084467 [Favolaschia claudopus]|uniref:F-box domain-containing protein n=1 Tax=Favolaschia claudopus TaxID=2862362 RepID=A0AAV9ZUM1_9AGAR